MKSLSKYIFTLIAATLFFPSCEDLDPVNYTAISPSTFPKTAQDAELLVTACYNKVGGQGSNIYYFDWFSLPILSEVSTDAGCDNMGGNFDIIKALNWTPQTEAVTRLFSDHYKDISLFTQTLYQIESIETIDEKLRKRYMAEIKVARAWTSFILFTLYGSFPVASLEVLNNPQTDVFLERPTDEWMLGFIEQDLLDATQDNVLPFKYKDDKDYGRFTKGMAKFLMLKLYMYKKDWAKAEEIGRQLLEASYGYGINTLAEGGYQKAFSISGFRNKEQIHVFPTFYGTAANHWLTFTLPPNYPMAKPDWKWNEFRVDWLIFNTFEQNDDRLKAIVGEYVGTDGKTYNEDNPGTYIEKGAIPVKYDYDPNGYGSRTAQDLVVFRYSDALLYLAEAINNNGRNDMALALSCVNQIRKRSNIPEVTSAGSVFTITTVKGDQISFDLSTVEGFNNFILSERAHELPWECSRRDDLIRHGKYLDYARSIGATEPVERLVRFPLPASVITESRGKIKQNEGYN